MDRSAMEDRTRQFGVRIIRLVGAMPRGPIGDVLGRQLLKSGTSIGANYREAARASSHRQFITMLEIVQREASETRYWLDLLTDAGMIQPHLLKDLHREAEELFAIVTASIKTAKSRR